MCACDSDRQEDYEQFLKWLSSVLTIEVEAETMQYDAISSETILTIALYVGENVISTAQVVV